MHKDENGHGEAQNILRDKLTKIAELEKNYAPFGVSFALRNDKPDEIVPPDEVADYVIAIINRTSELISDFDSIPQFD